MEKRKYDSTVARIAGNIAAGLTSDLSRKELDENGPHDWVVLRSVSLARAIVAEVERTEPVADRS